MWLPLLFQKGCVYFLEGGAFLCVSPPAAQHDLVERFWTQPRLGQVDLRDEQRDEHLGPTLTGLVFVNDTHLSFLVPEELAGVFNHLLVRELRVRLLLAEVKYLPQGHPKSPHVTGSGELALCDQNNVERTLYPHKSVASHPPRRTSKMLSHDIQRMGSTALPWIR